MPSPDDAKELISPEGRGSLLKVATDSIEEGLRRGHSLQVNSEHFTPELQARRACFVTLLRQGRLRGCIGHLEAIQPLVCDVADSAYAAAFKDPRFPPLTVQEREGLEIHISVLTPAQQLAVGSEQELLQKIRPGMDGLIIEEGRHRGTFLPSVWESLPAPQDFLSQLKRKAGLPANYWSNSIKISRYQTEAFSSVDTD